MTVSSLLRRPSGFIPMAMSAGALAMIAWYVAAHGTAPQPDEGAQAHLWQALMAGQIPVVVWFALRWLPLAPRSAWIVLGLQLAAAALAVAPLYVLGGL
jgi:hypothetical protein